MLSTSISLLILSYAFLDISKNPAKGYELSFYASTPLFFWIAVLINLANGFALFLLSIYEKIERMWPFAFFEILFANFSVISAYALRGYELYFGKGDVPSYVGMAEDITKYGVVFDYNFYPHFSILISQLNQLSGVSAVDVSLYLPAMFFVVYGLGVYAWSKSFLFDRKYVIAALVASMPIFFAWFSTSIYHMLLSVLMIPFFFLALQRSADVRFKLICLVFCLTFPLFHPITAIIICIYLGIIYITRKEQIFTYRLLSLSIIALVAWLMTQFLLLKDIGRLIDRIYIIIQQSASEGEITSASIAGYYLNSLGVLPALRSYLLMGFDELTFLVLSIISSYYIFFVDNQGNRTRNIKGLAYCFIGGSLFIIFMFFFFRIHTPARLLNLNWNMMLTPPLVGYLIYRFLLLGKRFKTTLILGLILISAITSVFSLYPSPATMRPNEQTTESEIAGANWLIILKDPDMKTANLMTPLHRYADLLFGFKFGLDRIDLSLGDPPLADHFGIIDDSYYPGERDKYLVISEYDQLAYADVWKGIDRFNWTDFKILESLRNVDRIYDNKEYRVYLTNKRTINSSK